MGIFQKLLFCIFLIFSLSQTQNLKIYQIDVNTGDAALIVSPTNKYILIDAGHIVGSYGDTVLALLQNLGITHLDHIITSHHHEDHIGGIPRVIYGLSGNGQNDSILGYCYDRGDTYTTTTFLNYRNAAGTKRRTINPGDTLNLGGGAFMFCVVRNGKYINGDSVIPSSGENYRSVGLVLQYGRFRFFTGGDLIGYNVTGERDVETKLAPLVKKVDLIKVSHHGSRNSSNPTFLDSLRPKAALISQGIIPTNNGHPHQEALDRLAARNIYIYQLNDNPSGGIIPNGQGQILNRTAVVSVNHASFLVNNDEYILDGVIRDGACLEIISPRDTVTEGSNVNPRAIIKNFGNEQEAFKVRFKIGNVYQRTQTIYGLQPNDTMTVCFDTTWYAIRGNYQISCSTEVLGDTDHLNDKQTGSVTVAFYDNTIEQILNPANNAIFYYNQNIYPSAIIRDNSAYCYPTSIKIFCQIKNINSIVYSDSIDHLSRPGSIDTVYFQPFYVPNTYEGTHICSVWVRRENDLIPTNNFLTTQFSILDPAGITNQEKPSYDKFNDRFKEVVFKIYNANGQLLKSLTVTNPNKSINYKALYLLTNLKPGIYFVQSIAISIIDNKKTVSRRKLVVLSTNR